MKKIWLLLTLMFMTTMACGQGDPAPYFKGQQASGLGNQASTVFVPNQQSTKINAYQALLELGNKNLLVNPSFEHGTVSTGWTVTNGTITSESTVVMDGKKSIVIVYASNTTLVQDTTLYNVQFADGLTATAGLYVKTSASGVKLCSRTAGATSTNCVTHSGSGGWEFLKVPFVTGATSQGLSLAGSTGTSGNVYIDSGFLGVTDFASLDASKTAVLVYSSNTQTINHDTDTKVTWGGSTSFSKLSNFTNSSGTFTATIAGDYLVTFGFKQQYANDASVDRQRIAKIYKNGSVYDRGGYIAGLAGNNINAGGTGDALPEAKVTAKVTLTAGDTLEFYAYQANGSGSNRTMERASLDITYIANAQVATAPCGANCVDEFSAFVSSAGVVSRENIDFLNGNCTSGGTGVFNCPLKSGIFTSFPNCTATAQEPGVFAVFDVTAGGTSNTNLQFYTYIHSGTLGNFGFTITCQKQGADFVATRTLVAQLPPITRSEIALRTINGRGSTNTCVRRFSNVDINTGPDLTLTQSATAGDSITVNTNGFYCMVFIDSTTAAQQYGIVKNSVANGQASTSINSIMSSGTASIANSVLTNGYYAASLPGVPVSRCTYLVAGDVLTAQNQCTGTDDNAYTTKFSVIRME